MGVKIIAMSGPQRAGSEPQITPIPGRCDPLIKEKPEREPTEITAELLITKQTDVRQLFSWLSGKGQLIFSDEPDKYYNVHSQNVISTQYEGDMLKACELAFICEPFAYSVTNPFVSTPMGMDDGNLTGSMTIISNGTAESCPLLYFSIAGKLRVTVNGTETPLIITTPGEYSYTEYSYDSSIEEGTAFYHYNYERRNIYIDTAALVAYDGNRNVLTSLTSGPFPTFKTGENVITFELVKETWEYDGKTYMSHNMSLGYFGYRKNERWY